MAFYAKKKKIFFSVSELDRPWASQGRPWPAMAIHAPWGPGTGKKENENNEKDENEEGTISSDAGEQAPKKQFEDSVVHVMERAARTIQSGGSVHFLGHGGVGAVGLVSPPDVVSTFGAKPLDVSAHLGTPGGWSALDIPFVSAPPDGTRDISREHFVDEVLPRLGSKDLVVILASGG